VGKRQQEEEAALDSTLRKLESETKEQDRQLLVLGAKHDQALKGLQAAVGDLLGALAATVPKGSSGFLGTMTVELKRFEEENQRLESLLAHMLTTQTAIITANGACSPRSHRS